MRDEEYQADQVAAYGASGQPAVAARMAPHLRMTRVGAVAAAASVLAAVGALVTFPRFTTATASGIGWGVFLLVRALLPKRTAMVVPAAAVGSFVSVPVAAFTFAALFALGGTAGVPFSTVVSAMVGVHVVIGIGEAVITALAVSSIVLTRPDLGHGARPVLARRELTIRTVVTP